MTSVISDSLQPNRLPSSFLGSSVHVILQARILEWVAVPSSRGPSQPRDQIHVSYISWTGRQILYHYTFPNGMLSEVMADAGPLMWEDRHSPISNST